MWIVDEDGTKVFAVGHSDGKAAARAARQCELFCPDEENEWVADEACSCYNCRYRRWTVQPFSCLKG